MTDLPLPADLDGEAVVLSACITDETRIVLDEARELLVVKDFYSESNKQIFEALCELADASVPIDITSLSRRLKEKGHFHPKYFETILLTPSTTNPRPHAESVREKSRLRQLISDFTTYRAQAYSDLGPGGVQGFLEQIESRVGDLAHALAPKNFQSINDVMKEVVDATNAAKARGGKIVGIPTGFDIDKMTGGLQDGELRIVAGRPGSGKSAYVLAEAIRLARQGYAVPFFSLEMPNLQIGFRAVASEARLVINEMRAGQLNAEQWQKFTDATEEIGKLPLWTEDTPGITLGEVRARVRRLQQEIEAGKHPHVTKKRIGAVYIDYLQLVVSPLAGERWANRENLVSAISRGLKVLSLELSLPVTAVSQLNRETERRGDKRPQLSDLRETGALEQDADTIHFIYRDEYYHPDNSEVKGVAEIITAKQRNGATGKTFLKYTGEYTRFDNLARGEEYTEDMHDAYWPDDGVR